MIFLAPFEILVYSVFYKDIGYDYLYRIYGHYKYNFSFNLVETEYFLIDTLCAIYDWGVVYLPFEMVNMGPLTSNIRGMVVSKDGYNIY